MYALTDFCLRQCYKPGQAHLMNQNNDICFNTCAKNMIEMRFKTK